MKTYDKKINQLIKIYTQAEKRLINIIGNKKVKGHVTDFYETMLKQVKLELMQLQLQSAKYSKDIVNELYMEAYYNSLEALDISSIGDGFAQLHTDAIELISDNMVNNFAEVNNQVGRRIEDSIRDIGLTDTQMKFATGQTIKQLQDELVNNLIKRGIGGIADKRGRVIPFTSYAELLSRSIVAETQNTCVMNVAKEHEKDLVKMTQHNTTCPICAVYEGRVYSLTGNDERFPKLSNIPGFNKGYNNIHPRCRHRITPYIEKYNDVKEDIKNSNRPFEVDKDKEASVKAYQEEQNEKARLRNDKKEYEKYTQILGEQAPKSLQSFREIKYNNSKQWNKLKSNFKIVSKYNVIKGNVTTSKILELHSINEEIRNNFPSKFKRKGNIAAMKYDEELYFAYSKIQNKENDGYIKYKGNKENIVLLEENRVFKTLQIPKEGGWNRHIDGEAKLFEFINKQNNKDKISNIYMITELPMCESCRYVLQQFIEKNPNIKLNIIEGADYNGNN
ncbi:phage minor capsid protein [Terrisporobacter vanillatitrophus]|uniref:phage minor capsid protein n=1 Tax=Terrisporobacter vanillatitrophus TaxID=3058402 RepID=UPI0033691172